MTLGNRLRELKYAQKYRNIHLLIVDILDEHEDNLLSLSENGVDNATIDIALRMDDYMETSRVEEIIERVFHENELYVDILWHDNDHSQGIYNITLYVSW